MNKLETILDTIANRRTLKPADYTGALVPNAVVQTILETANWAPTHGYTEPWRFVVYTGAGKQKLLDFMTFLSDGTEINQVRYDKRKALYDNASHIIAIGMQRGSNAAIPEVEEILAVGCAVQNMWLTAAAAEVGAFWSTGADALRPELAGFMGLNPETDKAFGFLFLGVPAKANPQGRRISAIGEKVTFVSA